MINVAVNRKQIAAFCRRHRVRRLAAFGSVLRQEGLTASARKQLEAAAAPEIIFSVAMRATLW